MNVYEAALLVCIASLFVNLTSCFLHHHGYRSTNRFISKPLYDTINTQQPQVSDTPKQQSLTQKEYLIAIRNRLFAIDEMIWLHEYAVARPGVSKVEPLTDSKYNELIKARSDLLNEYPSTKLYSDLKDSQQKNLTYASMYIDKLINNFNRQIPLPMVHTNQIAVLSFSGQVINLMRGQGAVHHRLLPSNILTERGVKRQFQHPAFSQSGKYISFVEMHFQETSIIRSDALVFEVPSDPKVYGVNDNMPIFDSGELPGSPFFLRFSPDDTSLAMLCTSPSNSSEPYTALVLLEWSKYHKKDNWAGQGQASMLAKYSRRKVITLLQGNPVFFTYTTSNAKNATIVAHCQKEIEDPVTKAMVSEKAVWQLQRQDTSGVRDYAWKKISASDPSQRWSTPICHNAGGGDSVLVIEDGWLTTKALSRWKRDANGELFSKTLLKVTGQVQFLVSADSSKVVVLQEDINIGHYAMTVIEGEDALDPATTSTGRQYELPNSKLTVAFWFSPDSTKILCLTAAGKSKEDIEQQKNMFKVGLNSEMQWSVFNFPLQESREYDIFKPTPYFMKTYVPFFSQYAQVFNPWAPDSRSFIYITATGMVHIPLVVSRHCLGEDKWQHQGSTFGTWSRN